MSVQIIEKDGRPEWAVIPYDEYQRMLAVLEDKADAQAIAEALADVAAGKEEVIPAEIAERLLTENPYLVWRQYRGMTQDGVADAADVTKAYISLIESGERKPSRDVRNAIAAALRIAPDDLE